MAGLLTQQGQQVPTGQPVPAGPPTPAVTGVAGQSPMGQPVPAGPPTPAGAGAARPHEDTSEKGEEKPNVTPQEQAQYDEFMNNAYKLIYSDNTFPAVLKRIKTSSNPVEAIANITASTVNRLKDSAEKAGKTLSVDVLYQGGKELIEDLADMTAQAGIHTFTDKEMESAVYLALDLFRQMQGPQSPADQAATQQDVQTLKGAQAAGGLDQLLPGLGGRDPAAGGGPAPVPGQGPTQGAGLAPVPGQPAPLPGQGGS